MRFRKLRIAWSVAWGLAGVLLIVLWVRSYRYEDIFQKKKSLSVIHIISVRGQLQYSELDLGRRTRPLPQIVIDDILSSASITRTHESRPIAQARIIVANTLGFAYSDDGTTRMCTAPHWCPVLICAIFAIMSWLCSRFSLRTLLIATPLVAVGLGLIAYATRR
jgi:hypothetical protein